MSKTIVVTGANRGIGLAFVQLYRARGDQVIALCRKTSPELSASGAKVIENIDVTSPDLPAQLSKALAGVSIDVLINNAGILREERLGSINYQTILEQFNVNAVAPLRVTEALLSNLGKGSKVALITSRMGSIADNSSGGYYGYRMSKAALNMAGTSLAKDLKSKGIAVALLHPGYVQTEMVGFGGDISADVAAQRLAARIDGLSIENSGSFWHSNGEILPW
ncbi:SDR family NAD(P)-dependent oxidoreductase [Saccharophagus sp. K07]|jgi:NAD(P)-dependent dehydrogenase (short-subunit alcohol dehydrogenase family)|uniref:SDR family oxidoreductase n=1 Tax=Saccharophagus sp. K07 TaxID=2283636 RepID=UPI001652776C|nr:SDR family oxidoreductase [Saccharophagus sp. K07]MBC6905687.1 SDR family NAD(P)-dependent oxidoreductase [Saccharophagus sp. K07]